MIIPLLTLANNLPIPWEEDISFYCCIPCSRGPDFLSCSFLRGRWEQYDPSLGRLPKRCFYTIGILLRDPAFPPLGFSELLSFQALPFDLLFVDISVKRVHGSRSFHRKLKVKEPAIDFFFKKIIIFFRSSEAFSAEKVIDFEQKRLCRIGI